jgi:hypothetical protein
MTVCANHSQPVPECGQPEDTADHRCLAIVNPALDVPIHARTVIAEDAPACDVARLRLSEHRIAGALPSLLALKFRRERGEREHHFVHGRIELALTIIEVVIGHILIGALPRVDCSDHSVSLFERYRAEVSALRVHVCDEEK